MLPEVTITETVLSKPPKVLGKTCCQGRGTESTRWILGDIILAKYFGIDRFSF